MRRIFFAVLTLVALRGTARADDAGANDAPAVVADASDAGVRDQHALLSEASRLAYDHKLVNALAFTQRALALAIQNRDAETIANARQLNRSLIERIPHVTFQPPGHAKIASVTFDDRPVPLESLTKKFSVDPGEHHIFASGIPEGQEVEERFELVVDLQEGELRTIPIVLVARKNLITFAQFCAMRGTPDKDCDAWARCFRDATTDEERAACEDRTRRERAATCDACTIGTKESAPPMLLLLLAPLAAIAGIARKRRRKSL